VACVGRESGMWLREKVRLLVLGRHSLVGKMAKKLAPEKDFIAFGSAFPPGFFVANLMILLSQRRRVI